MTTARIIGLPQVYNVDADPMSAASLDAAAKEIGADPGERVEIAFDAATNAGTRTYLVRPDRTLAYICTNVAIGAATGENRWDLWQWFLDRWARI